MRFRCTGTIYERRYHAEPVSNDQHLLAGAVYINANPPEPTKFRWSSFAAYMGQKCDIPVDTEMVLALCGGPKRFRELVVGRRDETDREAGRSIVRGQPITGSREFAELLEPVVTRRSERRDRVHRPRGVRFEEIIEDVAREFGIAPELIRGRSRSRDVTQARAALCAMAIREGMSAMELARELEVTHGAVTQLARRGQRYLRG